MFQKNKIDHRVTVTCRNGDLVATYSFKEDYDENWWDIAKQMFYDEFGVYPTETNRDSYEKA